MARRTKTTFDLVASLERLFLRAEATDDFAGAASLARTLRDLRPKVEAPTAGAQPLIDVSTLNEEELQVLDDLLAGMARLKERVAVRLGLPQPELPPRVRIADDPPPAPEPDDEPEIIEEHVIVHPDGREWTEEEKRLYVQVPISETVTFEDVEEETEEDDHDDDPSAG